MIAAKEALERLREGNQRFAAGDLQHCRLLSSPIRRRELIGRQQPFAVILGCSDSRVPAEIVFDQGLGDLFVIRVAGNIVAPSQIGSVELAVERLDTRLVVVLGHSRCGAVKAAMEAIASARGPASPHLRLIIDRLKPAVQTVLASERAHPDALWEKAVRLNIRSAVKQLCDGSPLLNERIAAGEVMVAGAEYVFGTGLIDFLDLPERA